MNQYDARQQFIEGLDRYVSGIETDDGLQRLAANVSNYHDRMPSDAAGGVPNSAEAVSDAQKRRWVRWRAAHQL